MAGSCPALQRREPIDPNGKAGGGDRACATEPRKQSVVTSARHKLAFDPLVRIMQFEYNSGVIVDSAPERGGKPDAADVDAARGQKAGAAFEQIKGRIERHIGIACKGTQLRCGLVGIAPDGEKSLDQ